MKRVFLITLISILLLSACGQKVPTWEEQYDLGMKYLSEGNYQEAIIAFTAAIEIDPKKAPAYVGRGDAYVGIASTLDGETQPDSITENYNSAEIDYLMAIELDGTEAEVYLKLADVYISIGDTDSAIAILEQGYEATGEATLQTYLNKLRVMQQARIESDHNKAIDLSNEEMSFLDEITDYLSNKQFQKLHDVLKLNQDMLETLRMRGLNRYLYDGEQFIYNGSGKGLVLRCDYGSIYYGEFTNGVPNGEVVGFTYSFSVNDDYYTAYGTWRDGKLNGIAEIGFYESDYTLVVRGNFVNDYADGWVTCETPLWTETVFCEAGNIIDGKGVISGGIQNNVYAEW